MLDCLTFFSKVISVYFNCNWDLNYSVPLKTARYSIDENISKIVCTSGAKAFKARRLICDQGEGELVDPKRPRRRKR